MKPLLALVCLALCCSVKRSPAADSPPVLNLWPGEPPGETRELPPEADTTKPQDNLIAGKRLIRLGNVSTPTLTVYAPPQDKNTGAAVLICPGGGHHILAWDLEGTEVAEWLNSVGVTGLLLKYRVPFRDPEKRWRAAVQDAQRAMSLSRGKAGDWGIDPTRIGILGFSAGGEVAALSSLFTERQYSPVDDVDQAPCRTDFAVLVYPGGVVDRESGQMRDYIHVTTNAPPMFFAHAFDDGVRVENSVLLFLELKKAGVPADLHVYSKGGHGYGLRETELPVTRWHRACEAWMRSQGLLERK